MSAFFKISDLILQKCRKEANSVFHIDLSYLKSVQVEDSRGTQWKDTIKWMMWLLESATNSQQLLDQTPHEKLKRQSETWFMTVTHFLQGIRKEIELPTLSGESPGTATLPNTTGWTASEEHLSAPWWTLMDSSCLEEFPM